MLPIPSLFEPAGGEPPALADWRTPDTLHCAPLGWQSIRQATARIAGWFERSDAALFVTDVSAELGQLARIASVPHVAVLQHGDRSDAGHMTSYESAVGILAPFAERLEQAERPGWMRAKTHYAPGLGIEVGDLPSKSDARKALKLPSDRQIVLVIAGGGGTGTPTAPLTLGARDDRDALWITIGEISSEWHETPPGNLSHKGWVDNPATWIAAADGVVSSAETPRSTWSVQRANRGSSYLNGAISTSNCARPKRSNRQDWQPSRTWPSHVEGWRKLWDAASRLEIEAQRSLIDTRAASGAADWLDQLVHNIWAGSRQGVRPESVIS